MWWTIDAHANTFPAHYIFQKCHFGYLSTGFQEMVYKKSDSILLDTNSRRYTYVVFSGGTVTFLTKSVDVCIYLNSPNILVFVSWLIQVKHLVPETTKFRIHGELQSKKLGQSLSLIYIVYIRISFISVTNPFISVTNPFIYRHV